LDTDFGYGYRYEKQIVLNKKNPELTVIHSLTNKGNKVIHTNPYCHNYFRFDHDFIGKNYTIKFSNPIRAINDFGSKATLADQSFQLNSNLLDAMPAEGSIQVNQSKAFSLSNSKTNTSVEVTSDVAPNSFYLYIWRMAFCPEPMILIDIKPGESFSWNTTYKFSKLPIKN
jgi:galactose mutarotase-like enzyme